MPRTSFAPAPTGYLHLGHVANAIYVWGLGHAQGAEVLLRIEDHDRQRSRREYEASILDDLDWLGFGPDLYPTVSFRSGRCESRQSDRSTIYERECRRLADAGLVYGCTCSRHDVARWAATPGEPAGCPARCRDRHLSADSHMAWRVHMAGAAMPTFVDLLGEPPPGSGRPLTDSTDSTLRRTSDPVIRDRLGNWTYQFAVVVDDLDQQIDLVIRGRDLIDSTPQQMALAALLGRVAPAQFAHHPLIMKSPAEKLSKSDGDSGLADLRRAGWTPERVIGRAAFLVGLTPDERPMTGREAGTLAAGGC
jgi:glutamyl/glutaminyl-tRNA synthetase